MYAYITGIAQIQTKKHPETGGHSEHVPQSFKMISQNGLSFLQGASPTTFDFQEIWTVLSARGRHLLTFRTFGLF